MRTLLVYTHMNNPNAYPPLGVVELATALKADGISVGVHDMTFDKSLNNVELTIRTNEPESVGLSTLSIAYNTTVEVAKLAKSIDKNCETIMGGPHGTACTEWDDSIDTVIETGGDFNPNLVPNRSLLPTMSKYLQINPGFPYLSPWTHIMASRGCPFDCSFCQPILRTMFGSKVRHRTVESVIMEVEGLIKDYGIRSFSFLDDTMCSNITWLEQLCKELKRGLTRRVVWTAQTNVRTLTRDRVGLMADAGCIFLGMGVESGSERILKEVYNKPQTLNQIRQAFKWCDEFNVLTEATLIIGAPEDTRETIQQTADLMREVQPDVCDIHYLTPTPGSNLYDKYQSEQRLLYKEDGQREGLPDRYTPGLVRGGLSERELKKAYWGVVKGWLSTKKMWRPKRMWFEYLKGLRGLEVFCEGLVRFLIYHNYYLHRILKEGVWLYRRLKRFQRGS